MHVLKAAGGIVVRNVHQPVAHVLLIKRNGVWDLPKGKLEHAETIEECAVREVEEETGIKVLKAFSLLCETYHEYEINNKKVGKVTYWYPMVSEDSKQELKPQTDEGITETKWMELNEAIYTVQYENLKTVLIKLKEILPKIKKA